MTRGSKPVEIVYYPKKARGPVPKRIQTVETLITEEPPEVDRRPSRKGRKTLTDETVDPAEQAFVDLTRLGHEAFEAGRADEARVIFESLVALGRRDPFAHTMLGTILLGGNALDGALEQFEAALAIDPDDLAALVYRGEIRLSRRKVARAVEDLERAVALGHASDPFVARARKLLTLARANRTS
ncbi:MAG: tetratricopeptide repeat protein [Archangium sp.]|nr:tetratricopeptide repeat protein [Archangium sp.]MDP3151764.1 tetratricopeptide repeat protein [Archangium sp.]MDP3573282.1 tetratricopeptide repeat protein [Archangium sp.]